MLKEWPLVAFTISAQTAVGLFLVAGLPLFFARGGAVDGSARGTRLAVVLTTLGLMTAAAALSFFHLHHPLRAVRVLSNLRTSWLSREILFELGFMALLAVLGLLLRAGARDEGLLRALAAAAAGAGLLFLWSMASVYRLPAVAAWDRAYTPVSFILTALLAGGLTAAVLAGAGGLGARPGLRLLLIFGLSLTATVFLAALLLAPGHGVLASRAGASLVPPGSATPVLHLARLILLAGVFAVLAAALSKGGSASGAKSPGTVLLLIAWLLALAGEVAGRFHFYGQVGRPGP